MTEEPEPATAQWLERKLTALDALYQRFGRDGLKDQAIADVNLFLALKVMQFRDAAKDRNLSEQQKADNRLLELQIQDLTNYVRSQVIGINVSEPRSFRQPDRGQQRQFTPNRGRDMDMDR